MVANSELLCGVVHGSAPLWATPYGCAHLRISSQLLEHTQIPELRAIVQVRVPGARKGTALSNLQLRKPSLRLVGDLILCSKCPESAISSQFPATAAGHPSTFRFAPSCR